MKLRIVMVTAMLVIGVAAATSGWAQADEGAGPM